MRRDEMWVQRTGGIFTAKFYLLAEALPPHDAITRMHNVACIASNVHFIIIVRSTLQISGANISWRDTLKRYKLRSRRNGLLFRIAITTVTWKKIGRTTRCFVCSILYFDCEFPKAIRRTSMCMIRERTEVRNVSCIFAQIWMSYHASLRFIQ